MHFLLLGEEPLLMRCAEALLTRRHTIDAIVSRADTIRRWAAQHGIPVLEREALSEHVKRGTTDVLASITYPALIPSEVLSAVKLAAVNFHDGPLPRYAGMNGSAWALLQGETRHAIVWHHLTAGLDDGDILEWRDVVIEARETSVSLNMKNAALALEAFERLIPRLESGDLAGTPQDRSIGRTEFSRHDRPGALAVIDWSQDTATIDHLVRACDFGHYANPFALPKLLHRGRAVIVHEAVPAAVQAQPGTVLSADATGLVVATADGGLRLTRLTRLDGQPLTSAEAVEFLQLARGDTIEPSAARADWAPCLTAAPTLARAEPALLKHLADRRVPQLPVDLRGQGSAHHVAVALPAAFVARHDTWLPQATLAAFTVLLSALLRDDVFDLNWVGPQDDAPHGAAAALISRSRPWRVDVPATARFDDWVRTVDAQCRTLDSQPGFLKDLVARHAVLRDQTDLRDAAWSSVAVLREGQALPPGASLALVLRADGAALHSRGDIEPETLAQLARRLAAVAETTVRHPDRLLGRIDALDDAERERQLETWNATQRPFEDSLRIHDLFERQVAQRPSATALVFEERRWTFTELDQAANRIAQVLAGRGIGAGQYVGLVVERGLDLIAAMIGVAKAGAAYVPIDTIYPDDRLAFMLEDSGCTAVLASSALAARCPATMPPIPVDGPEVAAAPATPVACAATSADTCYAIYTSGSTGKPKGVVLTHRAVVNTLEWVNREFGVGPHDRLLFTTSPSFDLSVYDIFGALGAGACVEIASPALLSDPEALTRRVCGDAGQPGLVTIWDSAPPALARLATFFPETATASRLRLVMMSGDWIPVGLPGQLMRVFPQVKVKSLGGATEAAIWSNYFHVDRVEAHWTSIPYGYPIQNARYDILDQHLRPVPPGIPGDLYIGGTCLAQGYLNRPALTAERFIDDPHRPGERLYKTGDLARFWDDGTMEFLGRADFQVKIRGYRVELGEIEAALCKLPGVQSALCTAYTDASGQKSLAAYVQTADPAGFCPAAARRRLSVALPDFMVPAHLIALRGFPMSSNGKIDRKALPCPSHAARSQAVVEPTTPLQTRLRDLWQGLLERNPVGIADNFFDIGGHSLLAVVMVQEMQKRLGLTVPLSAIVAHPTIESLSAHLEASADCTRPSASADDAVVALNDSDGRPLFFVYDGMGETLLYRTLAQRLASMFRCHGLMPGHLPGVPLAHASIEDMARHTIAAMRRVQPQGPYRLSGLCAGGLVAFEMAAQLEREGETVDLVMLEAFVPGIAKRPHTLARARLDRLRGTFRGGEGPRKPLVSRIAQGLAQSLGKLWGGARWEVERRLHERKMRWKLELLGKVLAGHEDWPVWVPPLQASDIFVAARDRYHTPQLTRSRVALVQATREQPEAAHDEPMSAFYTDPLLGWQGHVRGLRTFQVPGGHFTMLRDPHVDDLARCMKEFLLYPAAPPVAAPVRTTPVTSESTARSA